MSATTKRSIDLPAEHAAYVDDLVASGAYASESDVVGAALLALRDRDMAVEHWLRTAVAPAYDAAEADPERAIGLDEVFADLRARHANRLAGHD
ncbi:ribbon-helix-helix domain-containing protein [Jiella sonneratiae]|uniref:Type II toxin-antitoxin system ParD family antitoxin n=1 Tax=Jiella sonneratiae TaxID=2816856 RepID=A0ABS3J7M1_9HYPH|nr:type II toxin-antitoxin system ParD family antitoxin [Jiella sonneratiae]MBO0905674.1 type II toxin-antitoxin system ParD family antitoxin [Jiella sonneratiae]